SPHAPAKSPGRIGVPSCGHLLPELVDNLIDFLIGSMAYEAKPAACVDGICHWNGRPRCACADLRGFRDGMAAGAAMGAGPDGFGLRFWRHHGTRRIWVAGESDEAMGGSHSVSVSHYLGIAESAGAGGCAED